LKIGLEGVFESNDELATALTRIRDSYRAQLAVHRIKDADEILAQVEDALQNAAKAKNVVQVTRAWCLFPKRSEYVGLGVKKPLQPMTPR